MLLGIVAASLVIIPTVLAFHKSVPIGDANTSLQQVVVNSETGNVYVGGQNLLVHFDGNLTEISQKVMGPVEDSDQCPPAGLQCESSRSETDSFIKVLEIDPNKMKPFTPIVLVSFLSNPGISQCWRCHTDHTSRTKIIVKTFDGHSFHSLAMVFTFVPHFSPQNV